jgi:hypothetical protein
LFATNEAWTRTKCSPFVRANPAVKAGIQKDDIGSHETGNSIACRDGYSNVSSAEFSSAGSAS